ncbi:MAG: metal ABC transporter permease [Chthoniobacterales bacterium]|nr:metal ABC transporter permease [Chthoniobacterales bacterium]
MTCLFTYLTYDFVRNALFAGSIVALLGAVIGYFVILRNVGFAAHALAHIGFTGATGAALFGLTPLSGMLLISCIAGSLMGISGNKLQRSELAIGMVLSVSLGLGTLFLSLYRGYAGETSSILFGNIFGIAPSQLYEIFLLAACSLGAISICSRRLLFASLQPDLAAARGISLTLHAILFMLLLAVSVTLASQVVGTLLVFTLIVGPAGIAMRLTRSFWTGILCSIFLGLITVWSGILLACATNWPPSFWISSILFFLYLCTSIFLKP